MQRHRQSMKRLEEAGVMVKSLKFLVKIINGTGVRADPHKVRADTNMEEPTDVSGVIRFLGMVSHLGQYLPHLAEKNSPERTTEQKYLWTWGDPQQKVFDSIRRQLSQQPGLELYKSKSTDSLIWCIIFWTGCCIAPETTGWNNETSCLCFEGAQQHRKKVRSNKKGGVSHHLCMWAFFSDFLIGMVFHIEMDLKPLLGSVLPPWLRRLRMRLMRYN